MTYILESTNRQIVPSDTQGRQTQLVVISLTVYRPGKGYWIPPAIIGPTSSMSLNSFLQSHIIQSMRRQDHTRLLALNQITSIYQ